MKLLTSEQQTELQALLDELATAENLGTSIEQHHNLAYWAIELKPKRVRRKEVSVDINNLNKIQKDILGIPA